MYLPRKMKCQIPKPIKIDTHFQSRVVLCAAFLVFVYHSFVVLRDLRGEKGTRIPPAGVILHPTRVNLHPAGVNSHPAGVNSHPAGVNSHPAGSSFEWLVAE